MPARPPSDPAGLVQVRVDPPSGTIVLRRPACCNALTLDMLEQLLQAFDDLYRQRSVRAVILTGAGAHFSSGLDLAEIQESSALGGTHIDLARHAQLWRSVIEKMLRYPKPIVAAVNGPALAAGAALVLAADLVVGCPEAAFGFPEPRRGLVAGVAAPLLVFRLGAAVASRLLLTAEICPAEHLVQLGLYHDFLEQQKVWAAAQQRVIDFSHSAAEALALTKRLLNEDISEQLMTGLSVGAAASATARTTESAAEGVSAFLEKRTPQWP